MEHCRKVDYLEKLLIGFAEVYSEPCQRYKMEGFAKKSHQLLVVNYFHKTLHLRCLAGFGIRLWVCKVSISPNKHINLFLIFLNII